MFKEIIEYDNALDVIKDYDLTEAQTDALLCILRENPTMSVSKMLEITDQLSSNEQIILDSGTFSVDRILNESNSTVSLFEIAVPVILKHIPKGVIGHLTETHTRVIIDKILNLPLYENDTRETLTNRIDEMFAAGDISIPVQGLRQEPLPTVVVVRGMMAQPLHKGIQFKKEMYMKPEKSQQDNTHTLRNAIKDYTMVDMDTPLSQILPKFILVLKNLLGD